MTEEISIAEDHIPQLNLAPALLRSDSEEH